MHSNFFEDVGIFYYLTVSTSAFLIVAIITFLTRGLTGMEKGKEYPVLKDLNASEMPTASFLNQIQFV